MDLWIRSQNKANLIKVDILGQTDGVIKGYFTNGNCELGTYKSTERALEVLDEIQNILRGKYIIPLDIAAAFSSNFTPDQVQKTLEQLAVYEMPEK